jgi:hypothetical protein
MHYPCKPEWQCPSLSPQQRLALQIEAFVFVPLFRAPTVSLWLEPSEAV